MGDKTGIGWTSATWNPLVGCEHVSPGCDHCYAAREASGRLAHLPEYAGLARGGKFTGQVRLLPERLDQPLRWRKPRMIFVNSMSDLFHKDVPDGYIAAVFAVMAAAPRHTFQVLTKRHARMRSLLAGDRERFENLMIGAARKLYYEDGLPLPGDLHWKWPLPNVWLGVSVEDQQWADIRIPALLETPAAVRFLSCEPLLGPVDLTDYLIEERDVTHPGLDAPDGAVVYGMEQVANDYWIRKDFLHWVIVGGESGPAARPMHPTWARLIRDDCARYRVPFFFKQFGEYLPVPVVDAPGMAGGRAYTLPGGGQVAATLHERSTKAFQPGATRPMQPGDRNGYGVMLDRDTMALKVGKHAAGNELDGRVWEQFPAPREAVPA